MVKVFTPNKDGKIEFTKDELEKLLNEVWWDGRSHNVYSWTSPSWYPTWYTTTASTKTATVNGDNIYNGAAGVTVGLKGEDDG